MAIQGNRKFDTWYLLETGQYPTNKYLRPPPEAPPKMVSSWTHHIVKGLNFICLLFIQLKGSKDPETEDILLVSVDESVMVYLPHISHHNTKYGYNQAEVGISFNPNLNQLQLLMKCLILATHLVWKIKEGRDTLRSNNKVWVECFMPICLMTLVWFTDKFQAATLRINKTSTLFISIYIDNIIQANSTLKRLHENIRPIYTVGFH